MQVCAARRVGERPVPRPPCRHARRASRAARLRAHGVSLVEFSLVAPIALLLIFGLVILALVVLNQMELTNAARDGARAAAVCGGAGFASGSGKTLPNGSSCTSANLVTYIQARLQTVPGITPSVVVVLDQSGTTTTDLSRCFKGLTVKVTMSYKQPLYMPFVGQWLGDPGDSGNRTLNASAEATCEE